MSSLLLFDEENAWHGCPNLSENVTSGTLAVPPRKRLLNGRCLRASPVRGHASMHNHQKSGMKEVQFPIEQKQTNNLSSSGNDRLESKPCIDLESLTYYPAEYLADKDVLVPFGILPDIEALSKCDEELLHSSFSSQKSNKRRSRKQQSARKSKRPRTSTL